MAEADSVEFFYVKAQQFRVIHADGAIGSITPRGLIHMALFSERPAIPQSQEHEITPEGRLSEPTSTEGKRGIVRELDVDVMLNKRSAIELRDWLSRKISELGEIERAFPGGSNV